MNGSTGKNMGSTTGSPARHAAIASRADKRAIRSSSALAALGMALATPAYAAEESAPSADDQIVVTATRTPLEIADAPASVTVIDDEQIADQLVTDIKDLVRYEPGVSVRRAPARFGAALGTTGRARNEDFVIRGIGGNRVLIQVDGIRSPQGFSFGAPPFNFRVPFSGSRLVFSSSGFPFSSSLLIFSSSGLGNIFQGIQETRASVLFQAFVLTIRKPFQSEPYKRYLICIMLGAVFIQQADRAVRQHSEA